MNNDSDHSSTHSNHSKNSTENKDNYLYNEQGNHLNQTTNEDLNNKNDKINLNDDSSSTQKELFSSDQMDSHLTDVTNQLHTDSDAPQPINEDNNYTKNDRTNSFNVDMNNSLNDKKEEHTDNNFNDFNFSSSDNQSTNLTLSNHQGQQQQNNYQQNDNIYNNTPYQQNINNEIDLQYQLVKGKKLPITDSDTGHELSLPQTLPCDPTAITITLDDDMSPQPSGQNWYDLQFHDKNHGSIKKPDEIEKEMNEPSNDQIDIKILEKIQGSIIGMALGDALGAHVEFRPRQFLVQHPVKDLQSGGTWGLNKGQFTDDTSMALCLANSLIARHGFDPYDQLVRYKWWYKYGYMSSTGHCFDIGSATRQSISEFEHRQKILAKELKIKPIETDNLSCSDLPKEFNVYCSEEEVAGNGALMRLAPVPLFFYRNPKVAVEYSGISGQITHGDRKAYDACRYYGALIVAALHDYGKEQLLDKEFYSKHKEWFGEVELHDDIKEIAEGSYQKENGYDGGIRGKGYIVKALEAALWAFWSDEGSFEKGALKAVNLGDDTDTTAAIYGQLAGAYYGYQKLPKHWLEHVYAKAFMEKLSKWIVYEGECWQNKNQSSNS